MTALAVLGLLVVLLGWRVLSGGDRKGAKRPEVAPVVVLQSSPRRVPARLRFIRDSGGSM